MTGTVLEGSLYFVIRRIQKLRILRKQAVFWLLLLLPAIGITLWLPRQSGMFGPELFVLMAATLIGIILARLFVKRPSYAEAARLVEQADPELNDAILTAVQVSERSGHRPSVLAAMALHEADRLAMQRDWSGAVSGRQMMKWTLLSFLSFVVMVSSVMAASRYGRDLMNPSISLASAEQKKTSAAPVTKLVIEPGDIEIERGSSLTVVAKFPAVVPVHAALEFVDTEGATRQMAMTETVDAGVFAARMEEISSDGTYRVMYDASESRTDKPQVSPSFKVTTFVRPKLEQVDAIVSPPSWSGRPQETIEDVTRLKVTEGSTVILKLRLNKAVAIAALVSKSGPQIPLVPTAENSAIVEATLMVTESDAWTVQLQDAEGRLPADEEQISVKVTRNQPATVKPTFPGRDTNVSPLQEFLVEAKASDDFGLVDFGVQYSLSGGELKDLSLLRNAQQTVATDVAFPDAAADSAAEATAPVLSSVISHQIELESLNAAPDDLVTYSFWAVDIAADGSERRSYSDLMFAEVRRFEEIFREGQQPAQQQQQRQQQQQQQQQGSAVDGVLQLQKEIISATWNTIRAEAEKRRNGSFNQDVGVIIESQGQAIVQLQETLEQLNGEPLTAALAQRAMEDMASAKQKLEEIRDGKESVRLADAMPIEQSIVRTLLKMRAAEFQVRQQQQQQGGGGGGGGGSSASQQQLQQLELDNNRNRYESERQAQQQQEMTQQQREQLQVLNRLKELARRQQLVNERLKQLESELRAATSDKEREEIERELKRLRDEQREMLRDVDELSERMDQASKPQDPQSAQMKQQMDQARDNVQKASRAMDEGRLSEAISEGTRAERKFEQLKEDMRSQTSSQFDDAVRDLRDQARELGERQEQLGRQLAGEDDETAKNRKPSLKSDRSREQLQKEVGEQRDRLNRVVEQTKEMIEQAEQSEPLLSNKLYDTIRQLKDSKPAEALEATEILAGRGMWSQSQQTEQAARQGIDQLRKGIEQAADSVLGSQAESLRRAQSQLQEATEKLASEVRSATGDNESDERRVGQRGAQSDTQGSSRGNQQEQQADQNEPENRGGSKGQQGKGSEDQNGKQEGDQKGQKGEEKGQGGQQQGESSGQGGGGQPQGDEAQEGQSKEPQNGLSESGQQSQQGSQQGQGQRGGAQDGRGGQRQSSSLLEGGREDNGGRGQNNSPGRPLTGNEYSQWSDQLRDIEEMLDDPELRNRVAQVRDRARAIRAEFKRHGEEPKWDLVKSQLLGELQSLQQRINQEIAKLESDRAMVPIDREPVPEEFDSLVQRYYELLGQERGDDKPVKKGQ